MQTTNRSLLVAALAGSLALGACASQSAARPSDLPTQRTSGDEPAVFPIPMTVRNPTYPMHAQKNGISGQVRVRFDVDPQGYVQDIEVIESQPQGVFDESTKQAVAAWRYQPTIGSDGRATWVRNVRLRLLFRPH